MWKKNQFNSNSKLQFAKFLGKVRTIENSEAFNFQRDKRSVCNSNRRYSIRLVFLQCKWFFEKIWEYVIVLFFRIYYENASSFCARWLSRRRASAEGQFPMHVMTCEKNKKAFLMVCGEYGLLYLIVLQMFFFSATAEEYSMFLPVGIRWVCRNAKLLMFE